jgi:hypothetical protein
MCKYTGRHFLSKALLLLFSLLCIPGFAQKVIDLTNISTPEIENLFYRKLNDLHIANKLDALTPDKILKQAALNQSQYYDWIDKENFQYMRVPEIKKEFCTIRSTY